MPDTRQKILKAAFELFSEHGYNAVGMREVSQAAGVNTMTIYRLFKSKDELFDAVLQHGIGSAGVVERYIEALALSNDVESLREAYLAFATFLHANPRLLRLYALAALEQPRIAAKWFDFGATVYLRHFIARLKAGIKKGTIRKCDPVVATRVLVNAMVGTILIGDIYYSKLHPDLIPANLVESIFNFWIQGILPR